MRFLCPATMQPHARRVLEGEYDIKGLESKSPLRVLDVGANVGAFALWAASRWPGASIWCYEPHPDNFALLERNTSETGVRLHRCAVAGAERGLTAYLFEGRNNCGEASLFRGPEQTDICQSAPILPARELPQADLLKLDCEGAEAEILDSLFNDPASHPPTTAVVYEWHGHASRYGCGNALAARGWRLWSDEQTSQERGIAKWLRS